MVRRQLWPFIVLLLIVALCIAAALLIDFMQLLGGYADRRFILTLSVSFVVFGLCFWSDPGRLVSTVSGFGFCVFVIAILISALLNDIDNDFQWVEAILYPAYLLAVAGLALILRRGGQQHLALVVSLLGAGAMLYAFTTPAVYLFAITDGVPTLDDFLPWGFVNIRYWSQTASWLLPLLPVAAGCGSLKRHRLWHVGIGLTAAIWWWLLILSSARGSVLSIFIAAAFCALLFGRGGWPWLVMIIKHVALGFLAWLLLSVLIPAIFVEEPQMRSIGTDTSGRVRLWAEAWAMSQVNIPFGMGPQSWLTHEIITAEYAAGKKLGHPHNMYLMWAAEYGWLAVSGLALIAFSGFRNLLVVRFQMRRNALNQEQNLLITGVTASVVAAMIHAGASAVLIAPASMLIGLIVLSVFWAFLHHFEFNPLSESLITVPERKGSRHITVLFALAILLIWNIQVTGYYQAMRTDKSWYSDNVPQGIQPRFWFHGNFPRHPDLMPEE